MTVAISPTEASSPPEGPSSRSAPRFSHRTTPAEQLRGSFAAVRLSISWLGVRKTLTSDQRAQAADAFGAEGHYLSAAKKLLDTRHPTYKAVTAVRGRAVALWRGMSLPFPDPGVRLIRQGDIQTFDSQMRAIQEELAQAVNELDRAYTGLREAARERLGRLYNQADYPISLRGLFALDWDFPSVEPPDYLRRLNPDLYEEERRRVGARFDEAVKLAEQAFTEQFAGLVAHLTERLSGTDDGHKPKTFRDSAVTNLTEFFERFRQLNIHSSADLDRLVEQAKQAVRGVPPEALRESPDLRQHIATQMAAVSASLDQLMVDRPRRKVLRGMLAATATPESQSPEQAGGKGVA